MAVTRRDISINSGDGGIRIVSDFITLASGTKTWSHGLRRFRILSIVEVAAASIAAEGIGVVGVPNVDGWLISNVGQAVIKSSSGASAKTYFITAIGDGA